MCFSLCEYLCLFNCFMCIFLSCREAVCSTQQSAAEQGLPSRPEVTVLQLRPPGHVERRLPDGWATDRSDIPVCLQVQQPKLKHFILSVLQWLWTSRHQESRWTWTRAAFYPTAAADMCSNLTSCVTQSPTLTLRTRVEDQDIYPHSLPYGLVTAPLLF